MAFACDYCGKGRQKAHKVSHSNIKTRKWQEPNLQLVRVMKEGKVVESGGAEEIFKAPQAEYTQQLLSALPRLDRTATERKAVPA